MIKVTFYFEPSLNTYKNTIIIENDNMLLNIHDKTQSFMTQGSKVLFRVIRKHTFHGFNFR